MLEYHKYNHILYSMYLIIYAGFCFTIIQVIIRDGRKMVEYIYDEDKRTTILADVKDAPTPIEKRVNPLIHTRKKRKNVK